MEDLDYKDLFRDAIHTIAYIARAAGFDPNDPTVEPPAIIARIENQRADLERLTAERAAVRAALMDSGTEPVTEDMGRLAALVAAQLADEVAAIARLEQEVERLRALTAPAEGVDLEEVLRRAEEIRSMHGRKRTSNESARLIGLTSANATAAPALARALMAERDHVRRVEASEKRLMQEAEELRLTLAAEQGRPEREAERLDRKQGGRTP